MPMTAPSVCQRLGLPVLGLVLALAGTAVWAQASQASPASQAASGGTPWESLSPAQQKALAPLAKDWNQLPEERQHKWEEVAERFDRMSPTQRQRVQRRMTEWARMSPQERDRARLNYQKAQQLSAKEREARWQAYQALSPEQRHALAAKARPASASAEGSSLRALRRAPVSAQAPKSNIVRPTQGPGTAPKAVSPVLVQGRPGASTSLINQRMQPPVHQRAGQPKITVSPAEVDPNTLLPRQRPAAPTQSTSGATR